MKAVTKQHRGTLPQIISRVKMAKNYGSDIIEDPPDADNKTPATSQGQFKRKVYGLQDKHIRLNR